MMVRPKEKGMVKRTEQRGREEGPGKLGKSEDLSLEPWLESL